MRILVVNYSRTGNNKMIALKIAKILGADTDEIVSSKSFKGILGFMKGGRDSIKGRIVEINTQKNPSKYDLVVVGGPIWAGSLNPPLRAYLSKNKFKKLAFFSCSSKGEPQKVPQQLEELSINPTAALFLSQKNIGKDHAKKIAEFCKKIKSGK